MRSADAEAARVRANGQLWGQTVANLGQIPGQMQEQRQRQQQIELQRQNVQSEIADRAAQAKQREASTQTDADQLKLAQHTQAVNAWLGSIAGAPNPQTAQQVYTQGRAALAQGGVFDQNDLAVTPEQFPGMSWVKSRLAMTLPAAERFKAMFPEPAKVGTREVKVRNADGSETTQIVEDTPGQTFSSAAVPEKPAAPTAASLAVAAAGGDAKAAKALQMMRPPQDQPPSLDVGSDVRTTLSGVKYIDLGDYQTPTERSRATQDAKTLGVPVVPKEVGMSLQAGDTARQNIAAMMAQIESKLPKDAQGRVIAGPGNKLKQYFQSDADLAAFNSWRAGAIQAVQALVERGMGFRLNQAEINMIMQNDMPQITDTVQTARQRTANVLKLLDNKEKAALTKDRSALAPKADATPAATHRYNPATGKVEAVAP